LVVRTNVYVDGFNLYNRRLKHRPDLKWLNLKALCDGILRPPMVVQTVNYYTARLSGKLDPGMPGRQATYLAALATVPEISIHYGNFLFSKRWAALAQPLDSRPRGYVWTRPIPKLVWVEKAEEKGSDVNLACHLVRDALTNVFDVGIIISNDTDLVEPINIAGNAGKQIGLLSPIERSKRGKKWAGAHSLLVAAADFTIYIHNKHLQQAQFPNPIAGTTIRKPAMWV
jgi:uncharacterized LabA/DUF88 family protein